MALVHAALTVVSVWSAGSLDVDGCTSMIVGKGATVDGSAIASHANDCQDCDFRMVYVPARDHAEGSYRLVYDVVWSQYPRLVDSSRSPQYQPDALFNVSNASRVLGYIPQTTHTYALWENSYGLMNEKGLAMGESTCPAYLFGTATAAPGKKGALFTIGNLMTIALERCDTARCAIQLMGDLGSQYGFFGEDEGQAGGGEAVTIVDKNAEAWVFHITGGLPERSGGCCEGHRGALWVAQRVPDSHVAVVANNFIIRELDPQDEDNFMMHPGIFELTREAGLWNGKGSFDFLRVMGAPGPLIPTYTTIRMWGVFSKAAPSLGLDFTVNPFDYPFSVPVDKKISHLNVMDWFRSHYEGTQFDMTLGALAGPWQTPNRAENGLGMKSVPGHFARSASIHRTAYTHIAQSGIAQPTLWFAPDASASSVFVPFFASALSHGGGKFDIETFGKGSMKSFSFTPNALPSAWWAFDFVANWMDLCYNNMSLMYVYPEVQRLQHHVAHLTEATVAKTLHSSPIDAGVTLAYMQTKIQRHVVEQWWELAGKLVVRYNDHVFNFPEHAPTQQDALGYPAFWLEMLGFGDQSYMPTWVRPSDKVPHFLLTDPGKATIPKVTNSDSALYLGNLGTMAMVGAALVVTHVLSFKLGQGKGQQASMEGVEHYAKM